MPAARRQPVHRATAALLIGYRCRCGRWRRDLPFSRTSSLTTGQAMRSTSRAADSFSSSHWVTVATPPAGSGLPACRLSPSRSASPAIRETITASYDSCGGGAAQACLPACRTGRPRSLLGNMTSCSSSPPISCQFPHPFRYESRPGRYVRRLYAAHENNLGYVAHQAGPMCRASSGARQRRPSCGGPSSASLPRSPEKVPQTAPFCSPRLCKSGGDTFSPPLFDCAAYATGFLPSLAFPLSRVLRVVRSSAARSAIAVGLRSARAVPVAVVSGVLLRAGLAYRHSFFRAQRGARRPPHIPPLVLIGHHRFLCLAGIGSRGVSPPSGYSAGGIASLRGLVFRQVPR